MREPILTPGGLKIRFHREGISRVLGERANDFDLPDAFLDAELWANFPAAVSNVAAIAAALATRSWLATVLTAAAAFALAALLQQITYSHSLKVLFPQFLGVWFLALPAAIGTAAYVWRDGSAAAGIAAIVAVLVNCFGISDLLLLPLFPFAVLLRRLTGRMIGDTELAFMTILDRQAKRLGVRLDWNRYGDET